MIAAFRHYARYTLAPVSGVLLAWCFPTFHLYPLAWLALIPLFYAAATSATIWRSAACFLVAGWTFHSLLLQWLISNIYWAGGWAVIGYQLLCIALALFWAGFGLLWAWGRRHSPLMGASGLALIWVAMEWAQANLFTGFGWSALGYTQGPDFPLAQCAALGGVSFVSFILVLFNALLALSLIERSRRITRIASAVLLLIAGHVIGLLLIKQPDYASKPFTVGIFQSNFPQEMKWDHEYTVEMLQKAADYSTVLAEHEKLNCFVWPEALVMQHFEKPELLNPMAELARKTGAWLFTGAVRDVPDDHGVKSYNSSALIDPDGSVAGYYDKVHLAPFGEYMPFTSIFPFLRHITPMDVDAGEEQKVLSVGERHFGPLICFEVLFASLVENLRRQGADVLVVVTNLGWFGVSNAVPQELELARFRAIESRLPLVHAANTGISGVFDPWGRFQSVNAMIYGGNYYKWKPEQIGSSMLITQRCMGALPVAAPAQRPIPCGPVLFPWIAMTLALLPFLGAAFPTHLGPPVRAEDNEPKEKQPPTTPRTRATKNE